MCETRKRKTEKATTHSFHDKSIFVNIKLKFENLFRSSEKLILLELQTSNLLMLCVTVKPAFTTTSIR